MKARLELVLENPISNAAMLELIVSKGKMVEERDRKGDE